MRNIGKARCRSTEHGEHEIGRDRETGHEHEISHDCEIGHDHDTCRRGVAGVDCGVRCGHVVGKGHVAGSLVADIPTTNRRAPRGSCIHVADEGSGTVLGAMMIIAAALLLGALAVAGRLFICQTQARGVADTAAVSAATALMNGDGSPCETARQVAVRNEARLDSCVVDGEDVEVRARLPTGVPLLGEVGARSRAGPVPCE